MGNAVSLMTVMNCRVLKCKQSILIKKSVRKLKCRSPGGSEKEE
jgi:hypothetical protein